MRIEPDKVYVRRADTGSIDPEKVEAPFEAYRALSHGALSSLDLPEVRPGGVVLKPNATVLFPPEIRIITHPGFVGGLVDALIEKDVVPGRIVVADGQSGEQPEQGRTWVSTGYQPMVDDRGASLLELNNRESRSVPVPDGTVYRNFEVHRAVTDCSLLINVPVAKCHNLGCTTLSIKNLMGIVAKPQRHLCSVQEIDKPLGDDLWRLTEDGLSQFEERFYHKLCDLVTALRSLGMPRLNVVDGLIGRDGTAFNEGQNHLLGWTVAGANEVHVDTVATYLMGLAPERTPYLRFASRRGLGTNRTDEIEVFDLENGERISSEELRALRSPKPLMPISRSGDGYYDRFRADGSVVPWRIDDVNVQRKKDGLEPIAAS